ncbi:ribosome maturation factor RimM [Megasphaera elsdenii]|uniref:ribosome maturation factor RimM n=1 Tax=Megasphaera elsdenii TaxID=907 RepID=UPI000910F8ED|nr:ribosome maturation factor RimM [Megasphaera elsdenii]MCB5703454.1 ribosome maturation factor RimM [Megasphaera elsdenii]MCB5728210.1 ribosome maturation factor RimM [Megasphaera elsdenii]MCB5771988.1 ribosome maturation factor RimM [Megasphaera elsdenii]MCI7217680.1 ribosome maturation factor RimM [Megasphaera elsdenii]SHK40234.1 16S rRNA processing protein RimM [Megasphaera elsdenii]
MAELDLFTIGQIVAPHGVRGDVRIYPDTDFPKRFLKMKYGYINGKKYEVESARLHKRVVLMKFAGVDDRNAAELLVKKDLQVPREDLVPLQKGQHYIYDIIGSAVYDLQDHELGKLTDVLRTGSNDVYVVTADDGKETLLAAIPDVIKSIDESAKKIVVDPPEWVDE